MRLLPTLEANHRKTVTAMEALLEKHADKDTGKLPEEHQKAYDALEVTRAEIAASMAREKTREDSERTAAASATPAQQPRRGNVRQLRQRSEDDRAHGFQSSNEFLLAVMGNSDARSADEVSDERLRPLVQQADKEDKQASPNGVVAFLLPSAFGGGRSPRAAAGSDEHGEFSDQYGGFSVATGRGAPRPVIGFEGDPTEGRVEQLPMEAPSVELEAATDKDHTSSVAAGLTFTRKPETVLKDATRQSRELITFKATGMFGLAFATEELLSDSPSSFTARIANGFAMQRAAHVLNEKLRGKGGAEYLGILTALDSAGTGPTLTIAKEGGQAVGSKSFVYNNVVNMRAQCWGYSQAIWLANHDCYPSLAVLSIPVGVAGTLVYQQSLVEDRPDMLLGRPIFYTEYAESFGGQGDLILWNPSQYIEGIYQPLQSAESMHVRFLNHERAFKFWERNCAAPAWRVPLTPNKSAKKLSPSLVLAAR